jgi:hypothetical protein
MRDQGAWKYYLQMNRDKRQFGATRFFASMRAIRYYDAFIGPRDEDCTVFVANLPEAGDNIVRVEASVARIERKYSDVRLVNIAAGSHGQLVEYGRWYAKFVFSDAERQMLQAV